MTLQNNYSFLLRYAYPLFGLFAGSIFLITASVDTTDVPTIQLLPLMLLQRIALIFPVTFLLLAPILNEKTPHNILKKVLLWASIITAIFIVSELIILVSYSGALTMSIPMSTAFSLTFVYFSILVFTQNYLVNPYNPFDSQLTFQSINRLASTITVQLLFVGTVMLCMALLFALLTFVNVPQEVFLNMAVWISIGTIASTVGISIGKKQVFFSRAIEQLTKLFFHVKLPFVAIFSIIFLISLSINGLDVLKYRDSDYTLLMLFILISNSIIAITSIATPQENDNKKPPFFTQKSANLVFLCLPLFSALAAYNVYLNVQEHGLTMMRVWVILISLILVTISFSLVGLSIKHELRKKAKPSYTGSGIEAASKFFPKLFFTATLLVWFVSINIGLVSYLVAQSQVQNLLSNKQTLASFDISELRDNMGIQGLKVFNSLETQAIASNYPYLKELKKAIAKLDDPMTDDEDDDTAENLANNIKQDPYKNVSLLPSALNISPDDLSKIRLATETSESDCTQKTPCVLSIEKLNTENPKENFYIYIRGQKENRYPSVLYIHPKNGKVHELYTSSIDLDKKYKEDSIEVTQPIIQDIRIGNKIFRINESDIKFIFSNEADE